MPRLMICSEIRGCNVDEKPQTELGFAIYSGKSRKQRSNFVDHCVNHSWIVTTDTVNLFYRFQFFIYQILLNGNLSYIRTDKLKLADLCWLQWLEFAVLYVLVCFDSLNISNSKRFPFHMAMVCACVFFNSTVNFIYRKHRFGKKGVDSDGVGIKNPKSIIYIPNTNSRK